MSTKCPICKEVSCGDDYHTITKYAGPEKRAGDRNKVVLLQIFDYMNYDNFQVYEIKALINALIDEHIVEEDENV